jgi:radical SAM superfamily enzyme YgiQ (UPF0313 family)
MTSEAIDVLFIPYYYDIDRWHNDVDHGSAGRVQHGSRGFSRKERMSQQAVSIDGNPHDIARFLSWVRYGTTAEFERYDSYSLTLLAGTYYLNLLRRHGIDVRVANSVHRYALGNLKQRYQPRFVLLSTTLVLEHLVLRDAIRQIRLAWPEAVIVVGGLFLVEIEKTTPPEEFHSILRSYGADVYVVTPQGEAVLLEILKRGSGRALLARPTLPSTFVVEGATVHVPATMTDPPTPMAETFIRWQELPREHLYHTVHTRTARSCAFVCAFCNFPVNQGPLTLMPLETFEEELRQLTACGAVKSLIFTDDTFNVPQKRFKELCKILAKFDFSWYSFFRPQFADPETVELMKAAHCDGVFLGIESADDRVLKNMNKAATVATFKRGIEQLKKHDIKTHANFIVGFPGETEDTARKLVGFLDEAGIDFFTLSPFYFVPSTPIAKRKQEFGLEGLFETWKHDTMTSAQAFALCESLRNEPSYAVHVPELAANNFWTEILFFTNGFTVSEAQFLVRVFNNHLGADLEADAYRSGAEYAELRALLGRHQMPKPVNF